MKILSGFAILLNATSILMWLILFSGLVPDKEVIDTNIFYISNDGNDSNSGNSEKESWRSITKINETSFNASSKILFKRGDEFEGNIKVSNSGNTTERIVYGAYGTGDKPKIYGSEKITEWTLHSGNIYKATFKKHINQLFIDDIRITPARYPNTDKLFVVTTVNSVIRFTSTDLSSDIKYAKAKVHLRTNEWRLDGRNVIMSMGKTLTLNSKLPYDGISVGMKFFLVDKLDFLDEAGEWYSDGTTVYLWTPNGDNPAKHTVRGSTLDEGVSIYNKKNITIENLNILQQQETGINANNCTYLVIKNNDVTNQEERGIRIGGGFNRIENNRVDGINYVGLSCSGGTSTIIDNVVENIGLFENLGINGIAGKAASPYGMSFGGNNNLIQYNRIINVGYHGISFTGQHTTIKNNFIENPCATVIDGGAIYTYSKDRKNTVSYGSVIDGNIIIDSKSQSIYMDNNINNVEIKNNTVVNGVEIGIFFHDNYENNAHHNTLFHNRIGFRSSAAELPTGKKQSKFNNNNVIGPPDVGSHNSLMVLMSSAISPRTSSLDSNTYINHYYKHPFKDLNGYTLRGFDSWKTAMECDAYSTLDNSEIGIREEVIFYNNTKTDTLIELSGGTYKDLNGNRVSSLALSPFTSKILLKK